jgi:hypothetical protein
VVGLAALAPPDEHAASEYQIHNSRSFGISRAAAEKEAIGGRAKGGEAGKFD